MDILDEMAEYLKGHEAQFEERAQHLSVHIDYRDLEDWLERLARLLYAYTEDPDFKRHLPEEEHGDRL